MRIKSNPLYKSIICYSVFLAGSMLLLVFLRYFVQIPNVIESLHRFLPEGIYYKAKKFIFTLSIYYYNQNFSTILFHLMLPVTSGLLTIFSIIAAKRKKVRLPVIISLLLFLVIADKVYFKSLASYPDSDVLIETETNGIRYLKQDNSIHRTTAVTSRDLSTTHTLFSNILEPNLHVLFDISDVRGFTSMIPKKIHQYLGFLGHQDPDGNWHRLLISNGSFFHKLLSISNVKYLLTAPDDELTGKDYELLYSGLDMKIYKNLTVLPRVYIVNNYIAVSNYRDVFEYMMSKNFDPSKTVILNEKLNSDYKSQLEIDKNSWAVITEYRANRVKIISELFKPGILVLLDPNYTGWRAYLNSSANPLKIYNANYIYRAVFLPAGKHTIEFRYVPRSFLLGIWISSVTLIVLIVFTTLYIYNIRPKCKH